MTKLEKALEAVKLRMESAKPYHDVWSDEFLVIEELLSREVVLRKDYNALEKNYQNLVQFYDKHNGTPCEQIRHKQEIEQIRSDVEGLINAANESYSLMVAQGWGFSDRGIRLVEALRKFTTPTEE